MEVRDPIHGSIHIQNEEIPILEAPFFQRLRNVKQLGFSEFIFPGATHTRYLHSIGVMEVTSRIFDRLFKTDLDNPETQRLRETVRLAALLHDIGHAPLSHSTESVMPSLESLKVPERFLGPQSEGARQATHEDYTIKSIVDSSFTSAFKQVESKFGVDKNNIAELIIGQTSEPNYFTIGRTNYFPLLHQLISSEMDADRMDYLLRDSYFCGVSYGRYDLDWIIDNLETCIIDDQCFLGISERSVSTFDDFLLSRFHMFLMVYFHYRAVCLESLLLKYFKSSPDEYWIPNNIEEYSEHDDHHLMKILKRSQNPLAKRILLNDIPPKVLEVFGQDQLDTLEKLEEFLKKQGIDYIRSNSSGRLSKYYTGDFLPRPNYPIKVSRSFFASNKRHYTNIDESTDLFNKYSNIHSVNRIHFDFHKLSQNQQKQIKDLIQTRF